MMLLWPMHEGCLQSETTESEQLQGKAISSLAHLGQHMFALWGKASEKLLSASKTQVAVKEQANCCSLPLWVSKGHITHSSGVHMYIQYVNVANTCFQRSVP